MLDDCQRNQPMPTLSPDRLRGGPEAYNAGMKNVLVPSLRVSVVLALLALPLAELCVAQTAAPAAAAAQDAATASPPPAGRPDQTIQRIRTEDAGSRIDEVRLGGETQSITVQPKNGANMPAYQVKPSDTGRGNAPSNSNSDTNGSRVWNVLKF
jgi:hypothetical protein